MIPYKQLTLAEIFEDCHYQMIFYGEEQLRQTSLKADGMRAVKESVL